MGDFQYQPGVSPPPKIEGCVNVNPRTFQAFCSVLGKGDKGTYNKFLKDWDNWGSLEQGHVWYDYTAHEDFIWQHVSQSRRASSKNSVNRNRP